MKDWRGVVVSRSGGVDEGQRRVGSGAWASIRVILPRWRIDGNGGGSSSSDGDDCRVGRR